MGKHNKKSTDNFIYRLTEALFNLFEIFYHTNCPSSKTYVAVNCIDFHNAYKPGDEVTTYEYKFHITIGDELYVYDGWCYEEDIPKVPLGIYSHWLLTNYKLYGGNSSAFLNLYACEPNLVRKENI